MSHQVPARGVRMSLDQILSRTRTDAEAGLRRQEHERRMEGIRARSGLSHQQHLQQTESSRREHERRMEEDRGEHERWMAECGRLRRQQQQRMADAHQEHLRWMAEFQSGTLTAH